MLSQDILNLDFIKQECDLLFYQKFLYFFEEPWTLNDKDNSEIELFDHIIEIAIDSHKLFI